VDLTMGGLKRVEVGVRELVEFVWRRGDLRAEPGLRVSPLEGLRGHQSVQRSRPTGYRAEVLLSLTVERNGIELKVAGRADGIAEAETPPVVEEIKTVVRPLILIGEDSHPLHWAQAEIYAAILARERDLDEVGARLTYLDLGTREIRSFDRSCSRDALDRFLDQTLDRYLSWIEIVLTARRERDRSIRDLPFPYPELRQGQQQLIDESRAAIETGSRLFAQSATGTGKTAAILVGALRALPETDVSQLLFLTARTTGRQAAIKALDDLQQVGLQSSSLTLIARAAICPFPDSACVAGDCPLASGHFDRLRPAVEDALTRRTIDRDALETVGREHELCPFQLALELAPWVDVLICDLNYVFDPRVSPKVMQAVTLGRRAFLIDEAHNLVDRAREMFSADLSTRDVRAARAVSKELPAPIGRSMERLSRAIATAARDTNGDVDRREILDEVPQALIDAIETFCPTVESLLLEGLGPRPPEQLVELYFRALSFGRLADKARDRHVIFAAREGRSRRIKIFCIDPSEDLVAALGRSSPAIFFSATLSPLRYFARVLGSGDGDSRLRIGSPFPRSNLCLAIADRVSTRYRDRAASLERVALLAATAFRSRPGNYIVYLPSYEYLEALRDRFVRLEPDIPVAVQTPAMSEEDKSLFLARFEPSDPAPMVGFAVLGGVFGEGIDLVGDRLIGAIVVTVGLPGIGPERELIRRHFDRSDDAGFEFAYVYPGINRVLQAAGRVIRSETDRGVILLIDERFTETTYRRLLPADWPAQTRVADEADLQSLLAAFWAADTGRDAQ
jgi:DNA excision repair protein ERCC-2